MVYNGCNAVASHGDPVEARYFEERPSFEDVCCRMLGVVNGQARDATNEIVHYEFQYSSCVGATSFPDTVDRFKKDIFVEAIINDINGIEKVELHAQIGGQKQATLF